MFVASGEKDRAGLVADKALGDESGTEILRGGSGGTAFLQDGVGGDDFNDQGVTVGSRFEVIDFDEHRLPLCGFVRGSFLLIRCH